MADFHAAFLVVAAFSAVSVVVFLQLPADAGSSLSSHPVRGAAARGVADARPGSALG